MGDFPVLDCRVLTKKFGSFIAVDQLSFNVLKQDTFAFIGPNGAGKSTLMKMLTTILPPTKGDAMINQISILKKPAKVREIIGYVPQLISVDGSLTGFEDLLLFSKLYRIPKSERKQRILDSLDTMGLLDVANRYVNEYSGGMIRRLEIILAMIHKPKILFLDEPTSGLDPIARKVVWEHLKYIQERDKITIILTTHDMQEAEYLCNKIAILIKGKIVKIGEVRELKLSLGENATLNDVFIKYVGNSIEAENLYKEITSRRVTESRRGS